MHKNLKKIINLALIGAISSNNIIVFADELSPKNLTQNTENLNIDNYSIKGSKSTIQSPILTNAILEKLSQTTQLTDENEEIKENRSGTLTVKYLDWETNEEIKSSDFFDDIALGSYTYMPDEIEGYRLVSNSRVHVAFTEESPNQVIEVKFAKNTEDNQEVLGSITVKYIDSETNQELSPSKYADNLSLQFYILEAEEIEGYKVIGEDSLIVELTEESPNQVIEFKYSKKTTEVPPEITSGFVLVRYVDSETNLDLLPNECHFDMSLDTHTYTAKEVDGYTLVGESSLSVELTKENPSQVIEFKYSKNTNDPEETPEITSGSVTVKYIDSTSNEELLPSETFNELTLDTHTYTAKEVDGYTLVGESSLSVELTKENPNQVIEFKYSKNSTDEETPEVTSGSVTIKYIDFGTGKDLLPSESFNNLTLGNHSYDAKEIKGYKLVDNKSASVTLTEENPNQIIQFTYEKIKDYTVSADKDTITDAVQKGYDLLIIGAKGSLRVYKESLKSVKDLVNEISINITDTETPNSIVSSLILTEKLTVIDSFSAYSNLSELKDGYNVNISKSLNGSEYVNKKLYLYRINENSKNTSLQYIGEYTDVSGLVRFDINSKLLDGSDFIITSNKRDIDVSNNNQTNNNQTNNNQTNNNQNNNNQNNNNNQTNDNTNSNTQDKDKTESLPNSSGLGNFAPLVAISSIMFGFFMIFKKKKH